MEASEAQIFVLGCEFRTKMKISVLGRGLLFSTSFRRWQPLESSQFQ